MVYHISYAIFRERQRDRSGQNDGPTREPLGRRARSWHQLPACRQNCTAEIEDRCWSPKAHCRMKSPISPWLLSRAGGQDRQCGDVDGSVRAYARSRPALGNDPRITKPDCASYRAIFLEIGAPWPWDRVSEMSDTEIAAHFADPRQHLYYGYDESGTASRHGRILRRRQQRDRDHLFRPVPRP